MGKNSKKQFRRNERTYRGHQNLDKFLSDKKLQRKQIAKDGSCLFRAVAEQVKLFSFHKVKFVVTCGGQHKIVVVVRWSSSTNLFLFFTFRCSLRKATTKRLECSVWSTFRHTKTISKKWVDPLLFCVYTWKSLYHFHLFLSAYTVHYHFDTWIPGAAQEWGVYIIC